MARVVHATDAGDRCMRQMGAADACDKWGRQMRATDGGERQLGWARLGGETWWRLGGDLVETCVRLV